MPHSTVDTFIRVISIISMLFLSGPSPLVVHAAQAYGQSSYHTSSGQVDESLQTANEQTSQEGTPTPEPTSEINPQSDSGANNTYYFPLIFKSDDLVTTSTSFVICNYTIPLTDNIADGRTNYAGVSPGDVVCLEPGNRGSLTLQNFTGTPEQPIIFINDGEQLVITADFNSVGLSIKNSQHFHLTGTGSNDTYGIKIKGQSSATVGHGLRIGWRSEEFEVDHLEITNIPGIGVSAQTNPTCQDGSGGHSYDYDGDGDKDSADATYRGLFVQHNAKFHDNYLHNIGTEAFYVGSSFYLTGLDVECDSGTESRLPHTLSGVAIYNNIIDGTDWDALQVGSAVEGCFVYGNQIFDDSRIEHPNQAAGIHMNPGSSCHIYNNYIEGGKGPGMHLNSGGGNVVYNNIIVDAGLGASTSEHGIHVGIVDSDGSEEMQIFNNTIIRPTNRGINFNSNSPAPNSFVYNNLIVDPGSDYINATGGVQVCSDCNYTTNDISSVDFVDPNNNDYSLEASSPAIDIGVYPSLISTDYNNKPRGQGNGYDAGAHEYGSATLITSFQSSSGTPLGQTTIFTNVSSGTDLTYV
ncbi:MAG: right-handed parallel beta-helix repeat-containing protein, partial [Chloroflexota bacterium]